LRKKTPKKKKGFQRGGVATGRKPVGGERLGHTKTCPKGEPGKI